MENNNKYEKGGDIVCLGVILVSKQLRQSVYYLVFTAACVYVYP